MAAEDFQKILENMKLPRFLGCLTMQHIASCLSLGILDFLDRQIPLGSFHFRLQPMTTCSSQCMTYTTFDAFKVETNSLLVYNKFGSLKATFRVETSILC